MTVKQTIDQKGPATLSIFLASPSGSRPATMPLASSSIDASTISSRHDPSDRIVTIDMKHKKESEILSQILELTEGIPYQVSSEEQAELGEVEDQQRDSQRAKAAQSRLNEVKRREKAILNQARGSKVEGS